MIVLLGLLGCPASIFADYEAARDEALSDPGPAPKGWDPDIVVTISEPQLQDAIAAGLEQHGAFTGHQETTVVGVKISADPTFTVQSVDLSPSDACEGCFAIDVAMDGEVAFKAGSEKDTLPAKVKVGIDGKVGTKADGAMFIATFTPKNVRKVDVSLTGVSATLRNPIEDLVSDLLRSQLGESLEPVDIGSFGSESMPVRGVRVRPAGNNVQILMLSASPSPGKVDPSADEAIETGFKIRSSSDSLCDLAARAAFEQGDIGYGMVGQPTSLSFEDDKFELGMRLWQPTGNTWWRDYTANGTMTARIGQIVLEANGVTEGAKSPGAELADPLMALGEGVILSTIQDSIGTSVPVPRSMRSSGLNAALRINAVKGDAGDLLVAGKIDFSVVRTIGGSTTPKKSGSPSGGGSKPSSSGGNKKKGR